ncbi:hypothetical protein COEREDRAFT_11269 [Coemansia reversa NRRL 1564]|uniref:Uncharacterized protein n=1 Tax=Coemansia reversa (strain ATCC 12441 / NRRL 1564) TaxID=763665 RepID=A0A2G5B3I8_COERN|nr:hypothetical protein COEREDRAFT_11269 [Coemansia reversa NRRL 1564]|eukprot:PIA13564.1 hypothetical protein COEREDRAFT_11269 [Coemansia reversa NRRL 1564]
MAEHTSMEVDAATTSDPPAKADAICSDYDRSMSFPSYNAIHEFVTHEDMDTEPITIAILESELENGDVAEYSLIKHNWHNNKPLQIAAMMTMQDNALSDLHTQYAMVLEKPPEGRPPVGEPEMEINIQEGKAPVSHAPY